MIETSLTNNAGASVWLRHADPDLRKLLEDQGRHLLLLGASAETSTQGSMKAAEDACVAAERLARVAGLDVTKVLPSVAELTETARQTRSEVTSTGRGASRDEARIRVAEVALPDVKVHVVLMAGVAEARAVCLSRMITEPHRRVAGVFASRTDRVARSMESMALVARSLSTLDGRDDGEWSGDQTGRWSLAQLTEFTQRSSSSVSSRPLTPVSDSPR